ncbi:MAG: hypothetical protein CFE44_27080, partial [Burkholderiales bacterium PBB4]
MVIYAAGEGQKALDRLGNNDTVRNGLFTRVFLKEIAKPGVPIRDVLYRVRDEVATLAEGVKHEQVPAVYDQVRGTFYFLAPPPGGGQSAVQPVIQPQSQPPVQVATVVVPEPVQPAPEPPRPSGPEVVLKVHTYWNKHSLAITAVVDPWCRQIALESGQRLRCQIFPAMSLGGVPTQLFDQARDGVLDVVITVPGNNAGRFPIIELFELPFMVKNAEEGSQALWSFVQRNANEELREIKPLA